VRRQADGRADARLLRPPRRRAADLAGAAPPGRHRRQLRLNRQAPNLAEFVDVADPLFAEAGAKLQAVGSGDEAFLQQLRQQYLEPISPGRYPTSRPTSTGAHRDRAGALRRRLQLKVLGMSSTACQSSRSQAPLPACRCANDSAMLYAGHAALAHGVLQAIDDVDRLNSLQERAWAACAGSFDWSGGRQIVSAIASHDHRHDRRKGLAAAPERHAGSMSSTPCLW
jgi:hypothetical protein